MYKSPAFTLVETLLVIALIGILTIPFLLAFNTARENQALNASIQLLSEHASEARVFAREARDVSAWAVKSIDDTTYGLVSGSPTNWTVRQVFQLERDVSFTDDFVIWFTIGSGETDIDHTLEISNSHGVTRSLIVHQSGLINRN